MDTTSKVANYLDGAIYTTNNIISLPFVKDEYYTDFVPKYNLMIRMINKRVHFSPTVLIVSLTI